MKYYETHYLNDDERQEIVDKGLYVYDLRSSDTGGEIACIEKSVLVNRAGCIVTNEEIKLGEKYPNDFKDYQEFINENEYASSIDDLLSNIPFEYYKLDEIKNIFKSKERLVYADDGIDEVVIKYTDIPDFIVDVNRRIGMCDLSFYNYNVATMTPIITTRGEFLDKCNPEVRKDIIDRLVKLQLDVEPIRKYKIMDEYTILAAKEEMKKENRKKIKER